MLVVKTVKIPVHYAVTKHKLSIVDSLTARTTYGVWLWSNLFKKHKLKGSYGDRRLFYEQVKRDAKLARWLSAALIRLPGRGRVAVKHARLGVGKSQSLGEKATGSGFASFCGGNLKNRSRME